MNRPCLMLLLAGACIELGDEPQTAIAGRMTVGPGVVFVERGEVHHGTFERAAAVAGDGSFAVPIPAPGTWGVHLYVEGYIYLPLQLDVTAGDVTPVGQPAIQWQVFRDRATWNIDARQPVDLALLAPPADADPSDNPVIENPRVRQVAPGTLSISLDVRDPDGNLSKQELAWFTATGTGLSLNPPSPPSEDNYPDGTYTATYYLPDGVDPHAPWVFLAADNGCSVSRILTARLE